MPIFYIPIDGPEGDKLVSLMANLSENFDVKVFDALKVETEVEFLVPMLEKLEERSLDVAAQLVSEVKTVIDASKPKRAKAAPGEPKICKQCGEPYTKGGVAGCCSKKCYNLNYRATHEITVKTSKKKPVPGLPNQAKVNENLNEEQARIEAVVAKAKDSAPSASFEHHTDGPIMARKL